MCFSIERPKAKWVGENFTSDEEVSSGKSKELIVVLSKAPTQTVRLTTLNSNERAGMIERVSLVRVEYTDGTVWQSP